MSPCEGYLSLNNVEYISKELESQNIVHGIIDFYNWALLEVGNYQNVTINPQTSGVYGGQKYRLRPAIDPRFTNGQVWEGYTGDWVWESGSTFTPASIQVSGVYIGGSFYESDDATYSHYVDYKRGRIVFDSAIAITSVVTTEYSPRIITFMDSDARPAKRAMYDAYRVDDDNYLNTQSGNWNVLSDLRRELPFVAVSISPKGTYRPYQIGGGQLGEIDIYYYVFSQDKFWRDQMCDILGRQNDKAIWLPNRGTIKSSANYPLDLDYRGALVDSPVEYPDVVKATGDGGYRWRQVYFTNTSKQFIEFDDNLLYQGVVKTTAEIRL